MEVDNVWQIQDVPHVTQLASINFYIKTPMYPSSYLLNSTIRACQPCVPTVLYGNGPFCAPTGQCANALLLSLILQPTGLNENAPLTAFCFYL